MVAASPTPAGSHFSSLGRRTSVRQALRRPTSKPQLQSSRCAPPSDSSEDEIPVPAKLSALTKALLKEGHASEAPSTAAVRSREGRAVPRPEASSRPQSRITARRGSIPAPIQPTPEQGVRQTAVPRIEAASRPQSRITARRSSIPAPVQPTPEQGVQQSRRHIPIGRSTSSSPSPTLHSRNNSPAPPVEALSRPQSRVTARRSSNPAPIQPTPEQGVWQTRRDIRTGSAQPSSSRPPFRVVRVQSHESSPNLAPIQPTPEQGVQQTRRDIQTGSTQPSSSRPPFRVGRVQSHESSPAPRKRVVRLSASSAARAERHAPQNLPSDTNTPDIPVRVVRIPVGSSSRQPISSGSSGVPPKRSTRSRGRELPNEPVAAARPPAVAGPSSMRVKRVGTTPGSFLSGPARRGRFRQSEDEPEGQPEGRPEVNGHAARHFQLTVHDEDKENEVSTIKPIIPEKPRPPERPASPSPPRMSAASAAAAAAGAALVENPPPPPKMSVVETATTAGGAATAGQGNKKKQVLLRVNGRTYTKIDCVGRGGFSKVYRVSAENGKMLALKRVSLEKMPASMIQALKGEIDLLKRFPGVDRVIQVLDHEINEEKKLLSVVMELGELDFNAFLRSRETTPHGTEFDPVFVRYYWKEMLECVKAVHDKDVVHSDLKPANFVLVQGRLKVIDFGIANAIETDMTVNVHRDSNIGTPNYMSPESIMDSKRYLFASANNGQNNMARAIQLAQGDGKVVKLSKPSDVWSLGCILYQLVYGHPPFNAFPTNNAKMAAITNWGYAIAFPDLTRDGIPVPASIINTMRRCLQRDQHARPTCEDLLSAGDQFLYPGEFCAETIPITKDLLTRLVMDMARKCRLRVPSDAEATGVWSDLYWQACEKVAWK